MNPICLYRRRATRALALAATSLSLFSLPALAQVPPSVASQDNSVFGIMQPIVISATLVPTPADQIGNSISVVTAEDMERKQQRTLPDALKDVIGLNVVQTGGPVGQTSVFMRGTNVYHTKVLVDGIDVSDPSTPNGAFDFSQIPTWDVERIEVLRGAQSGLYGSDAIGGVINIITKTGKGPMLANGMVEGGSFGTFNQAAGVSGSEGRANYNFNFVHLRTADLQVTPSNLLPPGQAQLNDFYSNTNYSGKAGVQLTDNFSVSAVGRYIDSFTRTTTDTYSIAPFTGVPEGTQSPTSVHGFLGRGEAKLMSFNDALENKVGVGYTHYTRSSQDIDPANVPSTITGARTKLNWQGTWHVDMTHNIILGLEDQTEKLVNVTSVPGAPSVRNRAGFAEVNGQIIDRFYASASVRVDDSSSFGKTTTWRVAPSYTLPVTDTQLKTSYGTGFKAPSLTQLYVAPSGNATLQPEKSRGWDAGFEQPLLGNKARFGATYFHNSIKNLISFAPTFPFQNINVNRATTYGVETFAAWKPIQTVELKAGYTYTVARNDITGSELLRRPKNKASLEVSWLPIDKVTLTAEILRTDTWLDSTRDNPNIFTAQAAPYTLVNLAAEYRATEYATFFGRINNLLNQTYQEPIGFQQPTIGVFAGIRLTWGGVKD